MDIRKEFSDTEVFLKAKNLPQVILDRHNKAVSDYEGNYKKLKGDLDSIFSLENERQGARKKRDDRTYGNKLGELKKKIRSTRDDLETKVKKPRHQPLDPNNLPFRSPKPNKNKPRLKKEEFTEFQQQSKPVQLAYNGDLADLQLVSHAPGTDLPTAADLTENIEVQFTVEINELASSLDHNPVKIYNWVRNNIDFTPTWGSIQGANHCLLTKQCNAFDTSSLLIALLRTSGIPARYVMGTIEIPIDQFMNWVGGFTSASAAIQFAASGGIPVTGLQAGGEIKAAQFEHVWVEAYVDYEPSRGAVNKEGDTWVPLAGSFKEYELSQGIDLIEIANLDYEGIINGMLETAVIDSEKGSISNVDESVLADALNTANAEVITYLESTMPGATLGEVLGQETISLLELENIPGTLPYKTLVSTNISKLPNSFQYSIRLEIESETAFLGGDPQLNYQKTLPELAGARVTLAYAPATQADEDAIRRIVPDDWDGNTSTFPSSFPSYLIIVKPELFVEGEIVASGSPIGLGESQILRTTFIPFAGASLEVTQKLLISGESHAIGFNVGAVSVSQINRLIAESTEVKEQLDQNGFTGLEKDEVIGRLLYNTATVYHAVVDLFAEMFSRGLGVNYTRLPSQAFFSTIAEVDYLFSIPLRVSSSGLLMDVPFLSAVISEKNGDSFLKGIASRQIGMLSSELEHLIPESMLSLPEQPRSGISAVKAIRIAESQGIPIYAITKENASLSIPALQVEDNLKGEIQDAINAGFEVTVSERPVDFFGKSIVGYIIFDPVTGSGAYKISGGANGGIYLYAIGLILILLGILLLPIPVAQVAGVYLILLGTTFLAPGAFRILKEFDSQDWECARDVFVAVFLLGVAMGRFVKVIIVGAIVGKAIAKKIMELIKDYEEEIEEMISSCSKVGESALHIRWPKMRLVSVKIDKNGNI